MPCRKSQIRNKRPRILLSLLSSVKPHANPQPLAKVMFRPGHHATRSLRPLRSPPSISSQHLRPIIKIHQKPLSTTTNPPSTPKTIFSGIQPTGIPHLGNYLGALTQWVHLQNTAEKDTKLFFSIVDLHALTSRVEAEKLMRWKREILGVLLAVGLDPERAVLFCQSEVSELFPLDFDFESCKRCFFGLV